MTTDRANEIRLIQSLMDFEADKLTPEQIIELFQCLIDGRSLALFPVSYRRTAKRLIDAGLCKNPNTDVPF
jgi:hypothetical protein